MNYSDYHPSNQNADWEWCLAAWATSSFLISFLHHNVIREDFDVKSYEIA